MASFVSGSLTSTGSFGRLETVGNSKIKSKLAIGDTEANAAMLTIRSNSEDAIIIYDNSYSTNEKTSIKWASPDASSALAFIEYTYNNSDYDVGHTLNMGIGGTTALVVGEGEQIVFPVANQKISGSATSTGSFAQLRLNVSNLSNSGSEPLAVDGTKGRLFTVSDEMSGSIFSANTIAGLPVIEAFSDNKVNLGPFSAPVQIDSSGNLDLPADTSNTGSFYKEGEWTPVLSESGTATIAANKYVKIGSTVHIWAALTNIQDNSDNSNDFTITGLPFAGDVGRNQVIGNAMTNHIELEGGRGSQILYLNRTGPKLYIYNNDTGDDFHAITWADIADNDDIELHGTYMISI